MVNVYIRCAQCDHELKDQKVYWLYAQVTFDSGLWIFDSDKCRNNWIRLHQDLLEKTAKRIKQFDCTIEELLKCMPAAFIGKHRPVIRE